MGFGMASDPLTCSFLRTLAASKPCGAFLELGTGTGLSTAWLLDGMDGLSTLTSVDNDEGALAVAKEHLGADSRLTLVCEDGDAFLRRIVRQRFDFIFADTWSGKYQMLDDTLELLSPGGLYVIDDMLPQSNWPEGHAARAAELLSRLETVSGYEVTKLPWATGLVVVTKRGSRL